MKTDLLIIGAGPVGLFAAFQAGMLKLDTKIIDGLTTIGGQCAMLYPEKPIYDIPAYPKIGGLELIEKLKEQIKPFKQEIILGEKVLEINKTENSYIVITDNLKIEAKAIIIATGGGSFVPNRPPLEGILELEDKSVFYSVTNMSRFEDKTVVIAGGGDSAVDWAINLAPIAKKIYVVHRRDKFRAMQASLDMLYEFAQRGRIEMVVPYQMSKLESEGGTLKKIILTSIEGQAKQVECDYLLPFFGIASSHKEMSSWGLALTSDSKYISVDPSTMETNLKGIFAVGDIASYPGKLKLILTGFAEGALAAHTAFNRINPDVALHFEHSTSKGAPGSR